MKIKLNTRQIEEVRNEIKKTDRKNFDVDDVHQVFRMLQYWTRSAGDGKEKIQSVTELPDGFLCRVNRKFHDSMKKFLKETRARRFSEEAKERKIQAATEKYEHLIREAAEEENRSRGVE